VVVEALATSVLQIGEMNSKKRKEMRMKNNVSMIIQLRILSETLVKVGIMINLMNAEYMILISL